MKKLVILVLSLTILSCSGPKNNVTETVALTELEHIAKAYGIENFNKINKLQYTFNVQRDTSLFSRTWIWQKPSDEITSIIKADTVHYTLNNITDDLKKVDHAFINDKYWLFFPFQLVWDTDISYTNKGLQIAPISGKEYTMISVQYGNAGYTPGDAYDIYVDKNWIIREWVFRKSGQEEASLATTWEGYTDINGIKLATDHQNKSGSFRLFFTDVTIR